MHQFTFKRNQRLKSRKKIQKLFESGRSFSVFPFRITYSKVEADGLQVGFSVSKRRFKKAVDRNRIKRLMREAWRLNAAPLHTHVATQQLHVAVFLVYNGQELPAFHEVEIKMKLIISNLVSKTSSQDGR